MLDERAIIDRYFARGPRRNDVVVGIGDDAAVLAPRPGWQLVATTDTLVEGIHFLRGAAPEPLGHKALAVNLSDLAAMGAEPAFTLLALTLPEPDATWLQGFSDGFLALGEQHGVSLVGGNLARGPLSITVHALGQVPQGQALLRSGARPGDRIGVTGTLGEAAMGLACLQGQLDLPAALRERCLARLHRPNPRIAVGLALRSLATAVCDISDGLVRDLTRILEASGVGATIDVSRLPLGERQATKPRVEQQRYALSGGDDYELLFTVPANREPDLVRLAEQGTGMTLIGEIESLAGLRLQSWHGPDDTLQGFDHFR